MASQEPPPEDLERQDLDRQDLERLGALVADELPEAEALALRARVARDPAAGRALVRAEALEAELRAEPLLPVPLSLVGRILAASAALTEPPRRVRPQVLLFRVAACVLVAFLAWIAFSGSTPDLADMSPDARLVASIPTTALRDVVPATWSGNGGLLAESPFAGGQRAMRHAFGHEAAPLDSDPLVTALLLAGGALLFLLGIGYAVRQHVLQIRSAEEVRS